MLGYTRVIPDAPAPVRATTGSVGYDLACAEDICIAPGKLGVVRTGLVLTPPKGYWIMTAIRSSLSKTLMLANGVGIIDPDYCGPEDEVKFLIRNLGDAPATITRGSRVGQAILMQILTPLVMALEPPEGVSSRGGIGSTGK